MKLLGIACLTFGMAAFAGSAQAQLIVYGNGDAAQCYRYASHGNTGSISAIRSCTAAFETYLAPKDVAATHVNRGVLFMRKGDQIRAAEDYEAAIKINPDLAEAYINYAASLIRQEKYDAALTSASAA